MYKNHKPTWAVPDYVAAEPLNRGAYVGKYIPRRTGGDDVPNSVRPGYKAVRIPPPKGSLEGSSLTRSSLKGSSLAGSSIGGSSLGNTEYFDIVPAPTSGFSLESVKTPMMIAAGAAAVWFMFFRKK